MSFVLIILLFEDKSENKGNQDKEVGRPVRRQHPEMSLCFSATADAKMLTVKHCDE